MKKDVSSVGSERRLDRAEVSGSNPLRPTLDFIQRAFNQRFKCGFGNLTETTLKHLLRSSLFLCFRIDLYGTAICKFSNKGQDHVPLLIAAVFLKSACLPEPR